MKSRNILITGCSGYLAKHLVSMLAHSDHSIYALMRKMPSEEDKHFFEHDNIKIIIEDLETFSTQSLPTEVNVLMTLAQSSHFREFPEKAEEIFSVNVQANLKLFQWASSNGIKQIIHASSGGIYGGSYGKEFIENDRLAIDSPLGFYLGSKLCSEIVLQNYSNLFESITILRPFFIYGPNQKKHMFVTRMIENVKSGKVIRLSGNDGLRINPIFIEDAAIAFKKSLDLKGLNIINVAGFEIVTLRQIGEMVGQLISKDPIFEIIDEKPIDYIGDTKQLTSKLCKPKYSLKEGLKKTIFESFKS